MNKFKKSTLTTAVALILCCTTLVMTGFAATQNLTSYETFKNSLLNLPSLENATINGSVKLLDNGTETLSMDITAKIENYETMSSKASSKANGETFTEEQWSNKDQTVTKSSNSDKYRVSKNFNLKDAMISGYTTRSITNDSGDNYIAIEAAPAVAVETSPSSGETGVAYSYNVVQVGGNNQTFNDLTAAEQKLIHAAIDLVVGDVKNYFTANGKTITLNLEKNQIPQIAQLVVSVLAEKSTMMRAEQSKYHQNFNLDVGGQSTDLLDCFPTLTDDASIKSGNLAVTFDDNNNITAIKGIATVIGTDIDGVSHTITLDVDLAITDIGTTVADTIDLTDKEVEEMNFFRPTGIATGFGSEVTVTTFESTSEFSSTED